MSHYPWQLQERLGIDQTKKSKRVQRPTMRTPTTFEMNWSHSENGPTDPRPRDGVSTFMGVPKTSRAGKGQKWPDGGAFALREALRIARSEGGLACTLPPEDYDPKASWGEEDLRKEDDPELAYLREYYYEDIEAKKGDEVILSMTTQSDWIYIRCANEDAAAMVEEKFEPHFALGRVRHSEDTMELDGENMSVSIRTGNNAEQRHGTSVGTLFDLKKGNKVVSKCLCSYKNGEMDASGPTIELLETAAEWQRHGYATQLLEVVSEHFETIFDTVADEKRVKFNVCYCTNRHACEWFLGQGFRDWDGMGEELGRYLFE